MTTDLQPERPRVEGFQTPATGEFVAMEWIDGVRSWWYVNVYAPQETAQGWIICRDTVADNLSWEHASNLAAELNHLVEQLDQTNARYGTNLIIR